MPRPELQPTLREVDRPGIRQRAGFTGGRQHGRAGWAGGAHGDRGRRPAVLIGYRRGEEQGVQGRSVRSQPQSRTPVNVSHTLSRLEARRLSEGYVSIGFMSHLPISGEQPVVPLPDREPAAIRAAVARLDPAALARFEAGWTAATARARDEYSLLPARYFVEHWFNWVAVARWPELAARLRACERIVAESPDRAERRAAAAEISQILRQAETISA